MANRAGHMQSQKTVDTRKEGMFHGKIISRAKLLIITVNFGNKTKKVFSENFGWVLSSEAQTSCTTCTQLFKSRKQNPRS